MNERIAKLCEGAVDLHLHHDPSAMDRWADAIELADQYAAIGFRAICIKDHHLNAVPAAWFANKYRQKTEKPFEVYASVCLNNSIGLNPFAIETALRFGAKQIYMPTISASNPGVKLSGGEKNAARFLPTKIDPPMEHPLPILDDKGEPLPEVKEIVALIKQFDAILSTGHLSYDEAYAIVKYAAKEGLKKILLTHFDSGNMQHKTDAERKEIADLGAWVELTAAQVSKRRIGTGESITKEHRMQDMHFFGPERVVLGTDGDSTIFISPMELVEFEMQTAVDAGFTDNQIRLMVKHNGSRLLNLE